MILLKLLFFCILIFSSFASLMYLISRKFYHLSAEESEKQVKNLLVTGFGLFQNNEVEPTVTDILQKNCFDILQKNFSLSANTCSCDLYSNFGFYALTYSIVATFVEETFNLTSIQLKKCLENYFRLFGYAPMVYIYYEPYGECEFYFFLCYACTENCKTKLSDYIKNRQTVVRQNAINARKPVIDDALENELNELKKEI